MIKEFEGKIALVTGTASPKGLGRSICNRIASEGASLVMVDLNQAEVEKAAAEVSAQYGVKAIGLSCNVTKIKECEAVITKTKEVFGKLDFLINNAGVLKDNLLIRMSEEDFDFVLNVNLKGVFLMTKVAAKLLLKAESGRIVNISSVSGLTGQPGQANYSSSKAGVIALTKVTAREFAGRGVLVNAVCPGFVQTEMTSSLNNDVQEKLTEFIPLKRAGSPDDISGVVRFFLSKDASYITGTHLRVDGGGAIGM
jgi:3-oxoacyl-[acyl-carrier protein] reductase